MTELAVMRGQLHELRLAIARIVGVIGWPAVEFDGYRIGKGVAAWTEFLMADYIFTFDPLLLPRAASEAEAITNGATDGARSPKRH